ncbi:hypothetical protein D8B46_01625 [Candidatus Gracilibacteria bacterium]|nr:MAG: hypothetical protein D8B46_01625 [Candidatus Gracilibacteria bacterium]
MFGNLEIFEKETKNLEKKDSIFIVSDFDDTIFSTKEVIEKDVRKGRRGNEGNKYIEEVIGIENFIREFYENKNFPDKIIKNFDEKNTLILTAGFEKLQIPKIKATGLSKIPLKIVYEAKEKPFEMVKYIVQELKFIPREIHIYEDRPDVFLETKARIEKILDTKIKIFLVEMNGNETEPKITEI